MTDASQIGPLETAPDPINIEIRTMMIRRGVTQQELAASLGISQPQASARLLGRVDWRFSELRIVAELLRVPLSQLAEPPSIEASA